MRHLTPDELLDFVEKPTDAGTNRVHVESCEHCRAEAGALSALLRETSRVQMPEPSPLFWDQFSRRVRQAIADEPRTVPRIGRWLQWPVLVPAAGLALVVFAMAASLALRDRAGISQPLGVIVDDSTSSSEESTATLDTTWALVADLVGPIDPDIALEAGISLGPGVADDALLDLSAVERDELERLLREELKQPGG